MEVNHSAEVILQSPEWLNAVGPKGLSYKTDTDKMRFVLEILQLQIQNKSGYPFSAVIFDKNDQVIAIGVNCSAALNNSTAHAEILAIQIAQRFLEKPYLPKAGAYTLVASGQPCTMCMGAIYSSGVSRLVIGATEADIEEIMKFGQGPLHPEWREYLAAKKIEVVEEVNRSEARALLQAYMNQNSQAPRAPVSSPPGTTTDIASARA